MILAMLPTILLLGIPAIGLTYLAILWKNLKFKTYKIYDPHWEIARTYYSHNYSGCYSYPRHTTYYIRSNAKPSEYEYSRYIEYSYETQNMIPYLHYGLTKKQYYTLRIFELLTFGILTLGLILAII